MNETQPPKRRGPGRPPSKPITPHIEQCGIVEAPSDATNSFELLYKDPSIFKAIFTFFKNLKTHDIFVHCDPKGMKFFGRDRSKISRVCAYIDGSKVNWYYCDGEIQIGFNREHVEGVFTSIDKSFYKIMLTYSREDADNFNVTFKDPELDKECRYRVATSNLEPDAELFSIQEDTCDTSLTQFPVQFSLTNKQLKKTISDAGNYISSIIIEKFEHEPLRFSYSKIGIICYDEIYHDSKKIKLESDVKQGQQFRCPIKLANIKSFSSSMITDAIRILCREDADILFKSSIDDQTLIIYTLTKLS